METPKRRSVDPIYSMCVQPSFIIGTNNEDGTANFAPITWVSVTHGEGDGYLLVISMSGTKRTKQNVLRTKIFSANLVSTDMLPLMDYFGTRHAENGRKDGMDYAVSRGAAVDVPVLDQSRWVYECEVLQTVETGDSTTFFIPASITALGNCSETSGISCDPETGGSLLYGMTAEETGLPGIKTRRLFLF